MSAFGGKADIGPPFKQQILTDTMLPSARPRGGAKPARLEPRVRSRRTGVRGRGVARSGWHDNEGINDGVENRLPIGIFS
jgi:hypothetical protein